MTEEQIAALHCRLSDMTEDETRELDPIVEALGDYQAKREICVRANRVVALAAIDVMEAWSRTILDRE